MQRIAAKLTDEPAMHRLLTPQPEELEDDTPKHLFFGDKVLQRDKVCALTGKRDLAYSWLEMLHAAHIVPLSLRESWVRNGWEAWIQEPEPETEAKPETEEEKEQDMTGPYKMNSPQNGILLDIVPWHMWPKFMVTIDPDVPLPLFKVYGYADMDAGWIPQCFIPRGHRREKP